MRNAEIFAQGGAAKVYREAALTPTQLNQAIREILTDAAVQTRMTQNAAQTGSLTAAERVAQEVLTCKRT
jgi:UDP-N-acetylglucosamine:LPS N-acetylglucosamine transferase